jgi:uncharacterized repeat protein (TIGR03803 family)
VPYSIKSAVMAGIALTLGSLSLPALANKFSIIVNMPDCLNGCNATSPGLVAQGFDGALYTTMPTQVFGQGSVVAFPPSVPASYNNGVLGTLPLLYALKGNDGSGPVSGLTLGTDGSFYGAAVKGGPPPAMGTLFKVTFPNPAVAGSTNQAATYTVLYQFKNTGDGAYPNAPPVQGPDGNLYGVTYGGGNIYRISPNGTGFTVLATLNLPMATPIIVGEDGNLYGVTDSGGTHGYGTIFQATLGGQVTALYSFQGAGDGGRPAGSLVWGRDGMLYGTTAMGGAPTSQGVIFRQNPHVVNGYAVVHALSGNEGSGPTAGLVQGSNGNLYGVAAAGGVNSVGTLFTLDPAGTALTVLMAFGGNSGVNPYSTPTLHTNGVIYGATKTGGALANGAEGLVFSFDAGLAQFASVVGSTRAFPATATFGVLGQGFSQATGVKVGAGAANFSVVSDTYMVVYAPGGCVGQVSITEPKVTLVTPQVISVGNAAIAKYQICTRRLPIGGPTGPVLPR